MSDSLDLSLDGISERPTILVVEDEPHIREVLSGLLGALGYRLLMAASAEQALDALNVVSPDLVLTDVHLGAMSGIELCARLKADPRYELMPVVILTAVGDLEARVAGLAAGADDFFTKPVEFVELRTRLAALLRVKMLLGQLERAEAVITTLALTIEARDPYTLGHCDRLSRYAVALGEALGLDHEMLRALRLGGYLHDLGKIAVPDGILLKPGPLDPPTRGRARTWCSGCAAWSWCARSCDTTTRSGTAPAIPTGSRARPSRSGRASSRWSTSSTRSTPSARTRRPCRAPRRCPY